MDRRPRAWLVLSYVPLRFFPYRREISGVCTPRARNVQSRGGVKPYAKRDTLYVAEVSGTARRVCRRLVYIDHEVENVGDRLLTRHEPIRENVLEPTPARVVKRPQCD